VVGVSGGGGVGGHHGGGAGGVVQSPHARTRGGPGLMASVSVRYIVNDVDEAIGFYCGLLAFDEVMHPAPAFAMLQRGDLRLVLSAPGGGPGGGAAMADGTLPQPGGW